MVAVDPGNPDVSVALGIRHGGFGVPVEGEYGDIVSGWIRCIARQHERLAPWSGSGERRDKGKPGHDVERILFPLRKRADDIVVEGRDHRELIHAELHMVHGGNAVACSMEDAAGAVEIARGFPERCPASPDGHGECALQGQQRTQHFTPDADQGSRGKDTGVADEKPAQDEGLAAGPQVAVQRTGIGLCREDMFDQGCAAQDEIEDAIVNGVDVFAKARKFVFV